MLTSKIAIRRNGEPIEEALERPTQGQIKDAYAADGSIMTGGWYDYDGYVFQKDHPKFHIMKGDYIFMVWY